LSDYRDLLIFR